ncbi:general amidase [Boletus reticuloceps]|uniref:amidase n=1 Tax=Boletus reticuloceps TaxID=495285 RepID=A0A8I2Z245_9AGAM|nr:general amidase [Boletus reticuloceps]
MLLAFPETCGLLTPRELAITNEDVNTLLKRLSSGEWSAVEVTIAFYKRAIVAQQLVNCLTEIFVERALARAAELDDALKKTGKIVGPLHGLPISLKDQLCIKGLETTIGYVSLIGEYADKNAVLVDILEECGAVLFVRTNVPQTLMWAETLNNIFGRTTNPYNRSLTAGGSSGGEGALVALKGSPIGVGSDIGGSVRIPSAFCGVYGLKPSYGRVPYGGALNSLEGQDSVLSVFGPITSSISGLKTFMEAVIKAKPWLRDPLAVRKKWDEAEYQLKDRDNGRKLCFAIMWDDGVCVPHPPITRALKRVQEVLTNAGHNVIAWYPIEHRRLGNLTVCDAVLQLSENEARHRSFQERDLGCRLSGRFRLGYLSERRAPYRHYGSGRKSSYCRIFRARKAASLHISSGKFRKRGKISAPLDAIICPASPYAAPPHGHSKFNHYSVVWNALDYTASIFPVTTVDPAIDVKQPRESFIDAFDREVYDMYEPETFHDAPICLQLVGRTLEEEAVIAMTEIVDAALKATNEQL